MSTFGGFPGVWFILADVSEPSVRSIFKGLMYEGSETSANINQTPGNHPKIDILNTEHGESLKSRSIYKHGKDKIPLNIKRRWK
jgi:hypothetical protein